MQCPLCGRAVRPTDQECSCGELLTGWATLQRQGHHLRQRGLTLAAADDNVGAVLAFLEAALTNPLDETSLVDGARVLVRLGRLDDATAWLRQAATRPAARAEAEAVLAAVEALRPPVPARPK